MSVEEKITLTIVGSQVNMSIKKRTEKHRLHQGGIIHIRKDAELQQPDLTASSVTRNLINTTLAIFVEGIRAGHIKQRRRKI